MVEMKKAEIKHFKGAHEASITVQLLHRGQSNTAHCMNRADVYAVLLKYNSVRQCHECWHETVLIFEVAPKPAEWKPGVQALKAPSNGSQSAIWACLLTYSQQKQAYRQQLVAGEDWHSQWLLGQLNVCYAAARRLHFILFTYILRLGKIFHSEPRSYTKSKVVRV